MSIDPKPAATLHYTSHSGRVKVTHSNSKPVKQINDIARPKAHSLVVTPRPVKATVKQPAHSTLDVTRTSKASHLKPHRPERAKTLMRTVVHRPAASLRQRAKAQTRTDVLVKTPSIIIQPKHSLQSLDAERLKRAEHIAKSKAIRRFAPEQSFWFSPKPNQNPAAAAVQPTAKTIQHVPANRNRSMDIFQRALSTATAHEQPAVKPTPIKKTARSRKPFHRRTASVATASLAVVLLAGFFAYQNKVAVTLRFADAKAGFHATLPGYHPSGFASGKFHYSPGFVSVQYARAGTTRAYTVSQSVSTLNSQTLLDSTIAPHNKSYQTLQQGGRTIYLYGDGNAAWVDSGILYQISSQGNLTTNDIIDIATSV